MRSAHLLLAGALLLSQSAIAQTTHKDILLPLMPAQHAAANKAAKTTATASRLIGEWVASNDGTSYVPLDSVILSYSGTRGGDLYNPPLKYDNANAYSYNATTSTWGNASYLVHTFDANNNMLTEIGQNWLTVSSSWRNSYKTTNTFDANNDTLTSADQSWDTTTSVWVNQSNSIYTWDGSGNMLTNIEQQWSSGAWVNYFKEIYTYDASNNRLTRLQQTWNTGTSSWDNYSQYLNTYTSANKIATQVSQTWSSSAWENQYKLTYTYDASNNLLTTLGQNWDLGTTSWDNSSLETATFDGSHDQLTDLRQNWDVPSSSWINSSMTTNTGFAATYPLQIVQQSWSGTAFVNTKEITYTYNTHGQPTAAIETTWNSGGFWQPVLNDESVRLYYADYTTSVSNISNNNCTSSVYPVPAKDMLHVSITWNEPQAFSIEIMDMSGRTVSQWNMSATKTYNGNITISNLPAGNYIMKMTGTNAQSVQQIVVTK